MQNRDQVFHMRIDRCEREMIDALAERQGVSASDVLRLLIRREHAATVRQEKSKRSRSTESR